ncbi:MAG TPA: 3-oxoacyl-[acyl-carrier-protein] synthase III C-terminal domain-containing protein [Pirellulaceae bacterium]|nr:3-oxoacyl-[acyl-carrier-protein] synthase III C-terminal domain-containing protein [Pirellulaceae bacterium]
MAVGQHFRIIGSGSHLPAAIVTADEADRRAGVEAGWTMRHAGVVTRHECVLPETLATMAAAACRAAVADAGCDWSDLDLILDASTCRHQPIPCNAALVSAELGGEVSGIPCFDLQSTCLGFLVALEVVNALFAAGSRRRVLIVCSEAGLAGVDWRQPDSAALIGDGAAAVVVERQAPDGDWTYRHLTLAEHRETCEVRGGAHSRPPYDYTPESDAEYRFRMDGPKLFRVALETLPGMVDELIGSTGIARSELTVIPHQASPRAVAAVRRLLRVAPDRYVDRAAEFGNLAAASLPLMIDLERRAGRLRPGMPLLLLGTSAGYSQAGAIFRL